jgi:hypothetical protein
VGSKVGYSRVMGEKASQRCPQCGSPVSRSDYQCAHCELMLDAVIAPVRRGSERREVSVVRAMMERPRAKSDGGARQGFTRPPPGLITDPGNTRVPLDRVLEVSQPLRLQRLDLHPYEAWVVSLVDGQLTGAELGEQLDLAPRLLHGLLHGLLQRGALSLADAPTAITQPVDVRPLRGDATQIFESGVLTESGLSTEPSRKQPAPPRQRTGPRPELARPPSRATALPAAAPARPAAKGQGREDATVARPPSPALPAPARPASRAVPAHTVRPPSRATEMPRQVQGIEDLDPHGALQVALQMEQADRLEEAVAYLERAIARSPDAAPLYNRLAVILMRDFEDYARAEQLLVEALHLLPRHPVFTRNLATVKQRQQESRRQRRR